MHANPEELAGQNAQAYLACLANVEDRKVEGERWNKIFWASIFFLFCAGQIWAEEKRRKEVAREEQLCTARWERFIKNGFKDVVEEKSRPCVPAISIQGRMEKRLTVFSGHIWSSHMTFAAATIATMNGVSIFSLLE